MWTPPKEPTRRETILLKRLKRTKKLFAFLRLYRLEIFDAAFQQELAAMYRDTGAGKEPVAPAVLAMATLLQAYTGMSDAEAVEMTVVDARWQMVLDVHGCEEPAFGQGSLHRFREKMIAHDMDQRIVERTVEFARRSGAFDYRKLPKSLRLALDSRPLQGAGKVEDTINLLGRAAHNLLRCAAQLANRNAKSLARELQTPALVSSSVKRGLDVDWNDPVEKSEALGELLAQIDEVVDWIEEHLPGQAETPPLSEALDTVKQLREQDLDPEPPGGKPRIRRGVAKDRRISISEPEMRHGRKSRSKTINGYKSHLAADLRTRLILACAITPANAPETAAMDDIIPDVKRYGDELGQLHIDRGYVSSEKTRELYGDGVRIFSKPRHLPVHGQFTKDQFDIDVGRMCITCPADQVRPITLGATANFGDACAACNVRGWCTDSPRGRKVSIAEDEPMQQQFRRDVASKPGRERLRNRVAIEHRLAHHAQKQGLRARYRGQRRNLFDARRTAAVLNLEVVDHELRKAA